MKYINGQQKNFKKLFEDTKVNWIRLTNQVIK